MLEDTFRQLIQDLQYPLKPATTNPPCPYPLPEAGMSAGMGCGR